MRVTKLSFTNWLLAISVMVAVSVSFYACTYDIHLTPDDPIVTGDVSFSTDILPIFNQSCNNAGCHNTGGIPPDLSPANAYTALQNGNYISVSAPESSELYLWMRGEKSAPMPLSGPNANYNATVLAWIKQGAKNN